MKIPYKLVKLEWEDSAGISDEWVAASDYKQQATASCVSVGFIVAETKTTVSITPHLGIMCDDAKDIFLLGTMEIPASSIRRRVELR